jgi:hypothetical protein
MSKKRRRTYCLVIDASIARAAGSPDSKHPTGILCRDFLMKLRGVCHRAAWTAAIKAEWDEQQSQFALAWLVSMERLGKLRRVVPESQLPEEIKECQVAAGVEAKMLKDCHLVEAALATDSRVASLDDTVRGHFADIARTIEKLKPMLWVNPTNEEEEAVEWLEAGAPNERKRRLRRG